jgi:FkbM family methyltransferase
MKRTFKPQELLPFVQKLNGIGNYGDEKETGELFVIQDIVAKKYRNATPIIFDVGANVGNYALLLRKNIPQAHIYAFEPNKKAYDQLAQRTKDADIVVANIGFGEIEKTADLYTFADVKNSELGTSNPDILAALYGKDVSDTIEKIEFEMDTIDAYCHNHDIKKIDFLKIDVEGYEKNVLIGAKEMLKNNAVSIIQFEFNIMNIEYGIRLKDFYTLLPLYAFFRITKNGLIPLGQYNIINEVFQYQNILAVKND